MPIPTITPHYLGVMDTLGVFDFPEEAINALGNLLIAALAPRCTISCKLHAPRNAVLVRVRRLRFAVARLPDDNIESCLKTNIVD